MPSINDTAVKRKVRVYIVKRILELLESPYYVERGLLVKEIISHFRLSGAKSTKVTLSEMIKYQLKKQRENESDISKHIHQFSIGDGQSVIGSSTSLIASFPNNFMKHLVDTKETTATTIMEQAENNRQLYQRLNEQTSHNLTDHNQGE